MRRRDLSGCLAAACWAWGGRDEESIWREYLDWYRKQPASVSDLQAAYFEHLRRSGASETEARELSRIVQRLAKERREELHPLFFDRTYSSAGARFNTGPNALLAETVRDLPPGRALDVHMGQGRNAVFLASRGWDVTGFDFSEEGVRIAREAAARSGVQLTAIVARHEEFEFGRERWDLVVMSYTWVPLRGPNAARIIESLKPGGTLVFEHLMEESGGERAAAWLPRPNQLPELFGRLRILRYEDLRAAADWSWRPERIARLVARK